MSRSTCKVLYVSGEISPFVRVSALADFMASFPQAMEEAGCEARIMMPKYGTINDRKFRLHDVLRLSDIEVRSKEKTDLLHVKVTALPSSKIQTYFLYNEKYFKRNGLFADTRQGGDVKNSLERLVFFNLGILETLQRLGWKPDIIHCHDWYAGLVPVLLKTLYADCEFFRDVRTVLTIHNAYRQGIYPLKGFRKMLPDDVVDMLHVDHEDANLLMTAVEHSDALTTTSPAYAEKIMAGDDLAFGLQDVLAGRKKELAGIRNGLEVKQWNPSADKLIKRRFDAGRLEEKEENKTFLLEDSGLQPDDAAPLIGAVLNFERFQGADLLMEALDAVMKLDVRLVISATGDKKAIARLKEMAAGYSEKMAVHPEFTDVLYHQLMASSDMLLIPAEVESCGMMQFYAMCYGAVPVMYDAGGNASTVEEITGDGTGSAFVFHEYTADALAAKLAEAVDVYHDRQRWQELVKADMQRDLSWETSAQKYREIYEGILEGEG